MKRCEGMLKKIDGTFEQCDAIAEHGSDYCWECQKLGNTKVIVRKSTISGEPAILEEGEEL